MRVSIFAATFVCAIALSASNAGAKIAPAGSIQRIQNGMVLKTKGATVKVQFYASGTVRVVKWPAAGTDEKLSLSVVQKTPPRIAIRMGQSGAAVTLDSGKLKLEVSKQDGAIRYFAPNGKRILEEQGAAVFTPSKLEQEKSAFSVRQAFTLTADEGIYGLGQHQDGYMNYRGKTVNLVQANTAAVTPVIVSTAGYGIFWDNCSKTIFADDAGGTSLWSDVADNVDYYFFAGPSIDEAIAGYRKLTGQAPMYGKWAYGY